MASSSSSSSDGGDLSVNITESWRIQVGALEGDDVASAGVVLRNGDLVLAGSCGPSGSLPDGAFNSHIRNSGGGDGVGGDSVSGGSNFTAYRLDGNTGEPIWRWEGTTGFTTGDFLFAAGLAGGGGGGGDDATAGSGGSSASGEQEFVVLGGSTEGNWNNASSGTSSLGATTGGGGSGVMKNNAQIAAVKLDAATGEEIWRFQQVPEGGSGGSSTSGSASSSAVEGGRGGVTGSVLGVAGDPEGNIFLVGFVVGRLTSSSGTSSDRDFFVVKLDSATGGVIWRLQDGTPSEDDAFFAAATDSTGSVVAAGYTLGDYSTGGDGTGEGGGGGYDFIAAKFGRDGEELWRYQSGTEKNETFRAVTVDGDDNVYLGGESQTLLSEHAHSSPVVHKLDGDTGQLLWTYDEETSTNSTTFRSLVVDEETGLVVCAGVTDGDWARQRQSRGFGQDDFAVAFLESATGEQFGRWHSGSDADDALTFAGVSADGSVTLAGYTRGNLNGNLVTTSAAAAAAETEGADFAVIKFPSLNRKTLAPGNSKTPAPTSRGTNFDADFLLGPTVEPTRGGLRSTPGPSEASSDASGAGGATTGGGEGLGEEGWVVPVTVLGAIVGIFLLCGCCRCCFKRRIKEKAQPARKPAALPEGSSAVPIPLLPEGGATGIMVSTSPPPGHDGSLPWSGPTSLNAISVMHDVDIEPDNFLASPTLSLPPSLAAPLDHSFNAPLAPSPAGPGVASMASGAGGVGGVGEVGGVGGVGGGGGAPSEAALAAAMVEAAAGGGEGTRARTGAGARSMYLNSDGTSALASPENYVQFPQPFSGFDVPVLPYSMGTSPSPGNGDNGRGGGGGGGDGNGSLRPRRAEPEIDVTDLVMDNNDYYTPDVAAKSKSLEEAALVVAVAAASTKAVESGGGGGGEKGFTGGRKSRNHDLKHPPAKGFVSLDSGSSAVSDSNSSRNNSGSSNNNGSGTTTTTNSSSSNNNNNAHYNNHHHRINSSNGNHHRNHSRNHNGNHNNNNCEDQKFALAAVATTTAAAAAAPGSTPSITSESFDLNNRDATTTTQDSATSTEGTSFEDQTNNKNPFMFNSDLPPNAATVFEHEIGARARAGSSDSIGIGGSVAPRSIRDREGSESTRRRGSSGSEIPPTPRSMPKLLSMSFSNSVEGGAVSQRGRSCSHYSSSDDTAGLPPLPGRSQMRQQRQRLSPRYSSEEEIGLPPLSGGGGGSSSVRFPFLSNASIGRAVPGGGGGGRFLAPRPARSLSSGDGSVRTGSGYGSNASDGAQVVDHDTVTGGWRVTDRKDFGGGSGGVGVSGGGGSGGGGGGSGGGSARGTPAMKTPSVRRKNFESSAASSSSGDATAVDGDSTATAAVVVGVRELGGDGRGPGVGAAGGGGGGGGHTPFMSEGPRTASSVDTQTSLGVAAPPETAAPGWERSPANHSSSSNNNNTNIGGTHSGTHSSNGNATNGNSSAPNGSGGRKQGAASPCEQTDPAEASPRECRIGDDDTFDPKGRERLKIGAIGSGSRLSGSSGGLGSLLACVSGSAPGTPAAGAPGVVATARGGEERDAVGWWGRRTGGRRGRGGSSGGGGSGADAGSGGGGGGSTGEGGGVISGSGAHSDLYAGPFYVCGDMQEALSPRGGGTDGLGDMAPTDMWKDGGGGGGLGVGEGAASVSVGFEPATGTE